MTLTVKIFVVESSLSLMVRVTDRVPTSENNVGKNLKTVFATLIEIQAGYGDQANVIVCPERSE
jgi:hypothetical protein